MSKNTKGRPQKNNADNGLSKGLEKEQSFLRFKRTVEKEIENAILKRMKSFREDLLKTRSGKL